MKSTIRSSVRDSEFRRSVVAAWGHRCAFCGYAVQLDTPDLGLEAARIRWVVTEIVQYNARMAELQERWNWLRNAPDTLIEEPGAALADEAPAGSTGLLVKQYRWRSAAVGVDTRSGDALIQDVSGKRFLSATNYVLPRALCRMGPLDCPIKGLNRGTPSVAGGQGPRTNVPEFDHQRLALRDT